MIKVLLLSLLNAMVFVNAEMTCHYEALPPNSTDCPDYPNTYESFMDEVDGSTDYEGPAGTPECPLDLADALIMYNDGTLICEADMKIHMQAYEAEFVGANYHNYTTYSGWDTRPEGTDKDENNCNEFLDMYWIRCEEGAVDCVGAWGFCLNSEQTYYVTTADQNGGVACEAGDGDTQACITVCVDSGVDVYGNDCQAYIDDQYCTADGGEGYWYDGYSNGPIEQYESNGFVPLLCPQCGCVDTPVDCVASWSSCSNDATCQQTYSVTTAQHGAGVACEAANGATRACEDDSLCPVDCVGSWSSCSNDATCEQTYSVTTADQNGGFACEAADGATQACVDDSGCPAPTTPVGGEDCKPLDEAGCAAQPDSCRATNRGGKFRKCKPKRCKPLNESECEAAVHCEKKMGRRGEYKKCRRIDSSRA